MAVASSNSEQRRQYIPYRVAKQTWSLHVEENTKIRQQDTYLFVLDARNSICPGKRREGEVQGRGEFYGKLELYLVLGSDRPCKTTKRHGTSVQKQVCRTYTDKALCF